MAYWSYHTNMADNAKRRYIKSAAPWESQVGYSRAVRVGGVIAVSGSAPVGEGGEVVGVGDAYLQARRCIEVLQAALQQADAELRHVVRTRMFVTDISLWEDFARAHHEAFSGFPPATSMVEVTRLIDPRMLIEI